jgi:hypothetical protein
VIPARHLKPSRGFVFTLFVLLVCAGASVEPQTRNGSVNLSGSVSETVALSVPPTFNQSDVEVMSSGNTVQFTLSGTERSSPVIRVPLLVRSNCGFRISAEFESQAAELSEFSVADVHPTGNLVSPNIINALKRRQPLDPHVTPPLLVLTGPRVSAGGTLQSPNNALQMTLLIRVKPQPNRAWVAHLKLVATAGSPIQ